MATEVWTTVDLTGVAKSQINFVREHSKFEIAFNEDIFCCDKCEEMVAIFEENCPNCGARLHFEEEYA